MTVYLVGAGPGDPGLLTVRGAEVLAAADVVIYDRLAEASLLDLAPAGAERIDVGKSPGGPVHQDAINSLLLERGGAGLEVVRLKGGDPFVFGRGGEEAAVLLEAGVPFEVVPGVSAAVAVPAYAGIPVTHRGLSTSFTVVTGHSRHAVDDDINWEALAKVGDTLLVFMGVAHRAEIARRLIAGGLPAATPVAAVRWGTRPDQRTIRTTLDLLHEAALEPPVVIVIGEVAGLDLRWFERRPLLGRRVVICRARDQASDLAARLRRVGADPIEVPVIEIGDPVDGGTALHDACAAIGRYDWIAFTSSNAVERVFASLHDARDLGGVRVAAIGPGTAAALAARGVTADLVPGTSVAESLVAALATTTPGRILLPQAAAARPVLAEGLRSAGWRVDAVAAYRTRLATPPAELLALAAKADAIAFTSSSTVENYLAVAGPETVPAVVVSIGPVTSETARERGLAVAAEADPHTLDGLVTALIGALPPAPPAG